jgi:hypothetical protein
MLRIQRRQFDERLCALARRRTENRPARAMLRRGVCGPRLAHFRPRLQQRPHGGGARKHGVRPLRSPAPRRHLPRGRDRKRAAGSALGRVVRWALFANLDTCVPHVMFSTTMTPLDWSRLSPDDRRRKIGEMTQEQAVNLYAHMPLSDPNTPRLTRAEWYTLGNAGQQKLVLQLSDSEYEVVCSWGSSAISYQQQQTPEAQAMVNQSSHEDETSTVKFLASILARNSFWIRIAAMVLVIWGAAFFIMGGSSLIRYNKKVQAKQFVSELREKNKDNPKYASLSDEQLALCYKQKTGSNKLDSVLQQQAGSSPYFSVANASMGQSVIMFAVGCFYGWISLLLFRTASSARLASESGLTTELAKSIGNLSTIVKAIGIVSLVMLSICALILAVGLFATV